ncbi:MAG: branched-chain amino acid ABC transporter permease [bacterium]|nr:branched-chain amino acid ABC transporter permease [bacterium]
MFIQQLINGLTLGAIYALIALGYTMVYGILQLINFAHGEIYMIGGYIGVFVVSVFGPTLIASGNAIYLLPIIFIVSMLFCAGLGITIERLAYRPLRNAPRLAPLITAVGVSLVLQNAAMLIFGSENKIFPSIFPEGAIMLNNARISYLQIFIIIFCILLMVGLELFIKKTKLGIAMRATAQDRDAAALMGININRVIATTFFIGSALGAAAGVMVGMYYGVVKYDMGYIAGVKAFTAAVLGGIGNIPGAMFGGILLGVLESFGAGYISSAYKDAFAFGILVIVLIFKPSGLFGEKS